MVFNYTFLQDELLFLANALLLLSFLQRNQLMFRLVMISASLFFLFFNLRFDTIYLDVIFMHSLFIVINSVVGYRLFSKIIPPELDKEGQYLYTNTFSKYLSKAQFSKLSNIAKRRVFRVNSPIALSGNGFVSIFLVVCIPSEAEVKLRFKEMFIANLEELSWIGIVEYVDLLHKGNIEKLALTGDTGVWGIDSVVKFDDTKKNVGLKDSTMLFNMKETDISKNSDDEESLMKDEISEDDEEYFLDLDDSFIKQKKEVIIYEWTLQDLCTLYNENDEGGALKNSLHSLWLVYFSKYLANTNKQQDLTKTSIMK